MPRTSDWNAVPLCAASGSGLDVATSSNVVDAPVATSMEVDEPDREREGVSRAAGQEGSTGTGQSTAGEPQRPPEQGAGGTVYVPVIVPSERVVERVVERVLERAVPIPVPYPVPQPMAVDTVGTGLDTIPVQSEGTSATRQGADATAVDTNVPGDDAGGIWRRASPRNPTNRDGVAEG